LNTKGCPLQGSLFFVTILIRVNILLILFCITAGQAQSLRDVLSGGQVIICGHRGGYYDSYPENSLALVGYLSKEFASSAVMAEIDVRKSQDGTLYLMHDENLERTTSGVGNISEVSDTYLSTLTLKNTDGAITNERIPTFSSLLKFVEGKNVYLMVDIKVNDWESVLEMLSKSKVATNSLVLTFSPVNSKKAFDLAKRSIVSCLISNSQQWDGINSLNPDLSRLVAYISKSTTENLRKELLENGIAITTDASEELTNGSNVYPAAFYQEMVTRGVRILITDYPVEVRRLLKAQ
jgi:glycerophosphoryl diester phosphodiesterase